MEAIWIGGQVLDAVSGLPPDQRQAIELAYFEHLTQREIAEKLSMPAGTVKSRTFKALRPLRSVLEGRGLVPAGFGEGAPVQEVRDDRPGGKSLDGPPDDLMDLGE
jgi:hypothetical protein